MATKEQSTSPVAKSETISLTGLIFIGIGVIGVTLALLMVTRSTSAHRASGDQPAQAPQPPQPAEVRESVAPGASAPSPSPPTTPSDSPHTESLRTVTIRIRERVLKEGMELITGYNTSMQSFMTAGAADVQGITTLEGLRDRRAMLHDARDKRQRLARFIDQLPEKLVTQFSDAGYNTKAGGYQAGLIVGTLEKLSRRATLDSQQALISAYDEYLGLLEQTWPNWRWSERGVYPTEGASPDAAKQLSERIKGVNDALRAVKAADAEAKRRSAELEQRIKPEQTMPDS